MAFAHCLLTPRYLISSCQGACGSKTLQFINSSTRPPRRSDPWWTVRPPRFHMHSPLQKKTRKKKTRKNTRVIKDYAFQRHNETKCAKQAVIHACGVNDISSALTTQWRPGDGTLIVLAGEKDARKRAVIRQMYVRMYLCESDDCYSL